MTRRTFLAIIVLACVGVAHAGTRAGLSGNFVVDFQATMDMPFVTVSDPGNGDSVDGYGNVDVVYNIGKFEVTAGQYTEFLNAIAATDTYGLYNADMWSSDYGCKIQQSGPAGSYTYAVAADYEDRPVNFVNWGDAARFSNWLHHGQPTGAQDATTTEDGAYALNGAISDAALVAVTRQAHGQYFLPSEDEWYKAAYYDPDYHGTTIYYDYPTNTNAGPSNDLVDPDPGNNANFHFGSGDYTVGAPYWRSEVGEFENSDSPWGTFDQGGNVWEWNEAAISTSRGTRGGSFGYPHGDSRFYLLSAYRSSNSPTTENEYLGFRVGQVPEPGTLSLLALGATALLKRPNR